jgi:CheY-like chemotaxis protein
MSSDKPARFESSDTERPPPPDELADTPREMPPVQQVPTPGWAPPHPSDPMQRILAGMGALNAKMDDVLGLREQHERLSRHLDRMSQQLGMIASVTQAWIADRDGGNGLNGVSILLAEDDPELGPAWQRMLTQRGCDVVSLVTTPKQANDAIRGLSADDAPTHTIIDVKLGQGYGVDVARAVRKYWPATAIILATGFTDESIPLGVSDGDILKPATNNALAQLILDVWKR